MWCASSPAGAVRRDSIPLTDCPGQTMLFLVRSAFPSLFGGASAVGLCWWLSVVGEAWSLAPALLPVAGVMVVTAALLGPSISADVTLGLCPSDPVVGGGGSPIHLGRAESW
ncbi:NHL repeat-containing protein 2 [Striga asiatica]|uniref:NHL repeat-containing protein 2 n=1 Tax=Striga asiatica TaxID=4170 RepID=A0A5A7QT53_STRAF|nr:NHL repeat-containing protein 2 [Striga asiatica]